MTAIDLPPPNPGFQRLVDIVTRNGELNPDAFPIQCEPHSVVADDPGCRWPEPPRRSFGRRALGWAKGWGDWLLEVFSDD